MSFELFPGRLLVAAALSLVGAGLGIACAGPDPTYVDDGAGGAGTGGNEGGSGTGGDACIAEECPAVANATPICEGGSCSYSCQDPYQDCNGSSDDGCEADTTSDPDHCGGCDSPCPLGCVESMCNVATDISVGLENACALLLDGSVWCWGHNAFGEHGDASDTQHDAPVQVPLPGPAVDVSVGGKVGSGHACAAMADGTVQCWGDGNMNGNPAVDDLPSPPVPVAGMVNAVEVSAGGRHTCALQDDGDLFCWGGNFNGELGNGATLTGFEDDGAIEIIGNIAQVSAGADHTCARSTSGTVLCWGNNTFAQLGTGDGMNANTPQPIASGADEVAAGSRSSCYRAGTEIYCWGRDLNGAVGVGSCGNEVATPMLITVGEPSAIAVAEETSAAIAGADAHVVTWGEGPYPVDGETKSPPNSCLPTVSGFAGLQRFDLGRDVGCAVMQTGTVMCWGNDARGAVGDGPGGGTKPPTEVAFPLGR